MSKPKDQIVEDAADCRALQSVVIEQTVIWEDVPAVSDAELVALERLLGADLRHFLQ